MEADQANEVSPPEPTITTSCRVLLVGEHPKDLDLGAIVASLGKEIVHVRVDQLDDETLGEQPFALVFASLASTERPLHLVGRIRTHPLCQEAPIFLLDADRGAIDEIRASGGSNVDCLCQPTTSLLKTIITGAITDITKRQQTEEMLRAREAQIRFVTDNAPVLIAQCDASHRFKFVNKPYAERFGLTAQEIIGKTVTEVLGQGAFDSFRKYVDRVLQGERVEFTVEVPYERLGRRMMQCVYVPEQAAGGAIVGWVAVILDVTDRFRAEEAFRASEQRFTRFTQNLPGLAWIKDVQGRYVYANNAALTAFRSTREELIGKTDEQLFPPAIAAQFRANDQRALTCDDGIQIVETLTDEHGVPRHSLVCKFAILGQDNRPAWVGGMAIDITNRLIAEERLRRHKERLEMAQQAGRIGTFDWNVETGDVEWSSTEEELFGLPMGSFGGRFEDWKQTVHPDDVDKAVAECMSAVAERKDLNIEFRIVRPDGEVRWIAAQGKVLCDASGRPSRMLGVNIDITERKAGEVALKETDRRKDEFLATLAHELRNPLAPISNGLQILKQTCSMTDTMQEVTDMMDRQVRHLVRLVDDLLDVSRITRGKIELNKEPLQLSTIISRGIEASRPFIDAERHELILSIPPEPIWVMGDLIRLSQVVSNLLNNAANYTEKNGKIWIVAEQEGGDAILRVRDSGVGIEADSLPRIFDKFVQADRRAKHWHSGLGIGLALVRGIVELHGGTITASSEGTGRGSEFVVRLAAAAPSSPGTFPGPSRSSARPQTRNIFVVDDNKDAAESLATLLKLAGQDVRVFHDGGSALEAVLVQPPDIAFVDIGMPEIDGCELAKRMRRIPASARTFLVAVTGWGQEDDRRRTKEAGFDRHLVKPVDPAVLLQLVRDFESPVPSVQQSG